MTHDRRDRIEAAHPKLKRCDYQVTSRRCGEYNCVSWAAGDTTHIWSWRARELGGFYWPNGGVLAAPTVESTCQAFETLGYERLEEIDDSHEEGFEKVAIFQDESGYPAHAARQRRSGKWTSKLGDKEDIEHDDLRAVESSQNGEVVVVLRRRAEGPEPATRCPVEIVLPDRHAPSGRRVRC